MKRVLVVFPFVRFLCGTQSSFGSTPEPEIPTVTPSPTAVPVLTTDMIRRFDGYIDANL